MEKKIPPKNYMILIGMIILIICASFAFYNVYNIVQENKIQTSPLSTKTVLYKDLKNAMIDIEADSFLVISYTQDREVYNNEKEIRKFLKSKDLIDNVIYLDVTEEKDEENFIEELNTVLKVKETKLEIKKLPAVIYYKNTDATAMYDSKNSLINKSNFQQLVDVYELAS